MSPAVWHCQTFLVLTQSRTVYVTLMPLPLPFPSFRFGFAVSFVPLPLMVYGRTAKRVDPIAICNGTAATADISNGTTEFFFYVSYVVFTVDT